MPSKFFRPDLYRKNVNEIIEIAAIRKGIRTHKALALLLGYSERMISTRFANGWRAEDLRRLDDILRFTTDELERLIRG